MTYATVSSALEAINVEAIERAVSHYTDGKFYVDIYKCGTCVFPLVDERKTPRDSSVQLKNLLSHPLDFVVKEMDDGNFVVRFDEFIFSVVLAQEFAQREAKVEQQLKSYAEDEVVAGARSQPKAHLLIGVFARTRLLEDIRDVTLSRSVIPRNLGK